MWQSGKISWFFDQLTQLPNDWKRQKGKSMMKWLVLNAAVWTFVHFDCLKLLHSNGFCCYGDAGYYCYCCPRRWYKENHHEMSHYQHVFDRRTNVELRWNGCETNVYYSIPLNLMWAYVSLESEFKWFELKAFPEFWLITYSVSCT